MNLLAGDNVMFYVIARACDADERGMTRKSYRNLGIDDSITADRISAFDCLLWYFQDMDAIASEAMREANAAERLLGALP